ncbi:hypothetical protein FBY06_12450 [Pseudomonas sp. SJZ085]|nr:hypothetical protein FBX99_12450 [Pseudomonas sp. SJZ074]TWC19865.1 hypothetical protein FBY00_105235 [Pseudomonas sp. SJZ075]TWC33509.1 hypothetical protein FBY06_12450 [Pseudomonas sp. SJZ085]TWC35235.1 hypothetical protein FBY02_1052 [Pseudomonas sp. SJZ078]TWC56181.1 hypothetical protein FBY11_1052 [Pseudomonas sp. SJZ124]TWC91867.1 hypothetical protein FBY09_105235 [Pseudomonas sp. SJZ101]
MPIHYFTGYSGFPIFALRLPRLFAVMSSPHNSVDVFKALADDSRTRTRTRIALLVAREEECASMHSLRRWT